MEDEESKMDIDDSADLKLVVVVQASPATSEADKASSAVVNDYPTPFELTAQLTCLMLSHVLNNPMWTASPFVQSTLNPRSLHPWSGTSWINKAAPFRRRCLRRME